MGVVLPILPKQIIIEGDGSFSNAVIMGGSQKGTSTLYKRAQANYDAALSNLNQTEQKIATKQQELAPIEGFVNKWRPAIDINDWRAAYEEIMQRGRYQADIMWPGYRQRFPLATMSDYLNDIYTGYSGMAIFQAIQKDIVRQAIQEAEAKAAGIRNTIASLETSRVSQQKAVDTAKKALDEALLKEQQASDQRIKESLSSPEFIRAQAEAESKKRRSRNILVLGGLVVLITGAVLIFRKPS